MAIIGNREYFKGVPEYREEIRVKFSGARRNVFLKLRPSSS